MEDILSKSIVEKLDMQAGQIREMQSTVNEISEQHIRIQQDITKVKATVNGIFFPTEQINQLTQTISVLKERLHHLLQTREHHFRVMVKFWLTIIVLAAVVFFTGRQWHLTNQELTHYIASDTKYRYLKLNGSKPLKELLFITDSLYRADPGMRDSVLWREQVIREQWELQQQIQVKESELKVLKEKKEKSRLKTTFWSE